MSSKVITRTLLIRNMTCVNCENIIEQELSKIPAILQVKASYSQGTVTVTYDESVVRLEEIEKVLEQADYHIKRETPDNGSASEKEKQGITGKVGSGTKKTDFSDLVSVLIIMLAVYMIADRFGLLNIFQAFPVAKEGMGYGMLFVIGLLTSVHCVAMCGGICLSQCVPKNQIVKEKPGLMDTMRPSLLYNLGRVISYTVIGAVVGAIGSVVSFSGTMKGLVQLAAGVFMVIMGLNMLNIFPGLKRLNPRMPKIFARLVYSKRGSSSPLYIGILNGLMPCGPLQAMQLYALSTGSPVKGAVAMFLFSAGTFPLMFAFGALSSFMNKKFSGKLMTVSAVLVVVLGMFMFSNGISLSGLGFPSLPMSNQAQAGSAGVAKIEDGVQVVTTGLSSGRYEPIVVQKGIPVKWVIQAENGQINGCNNSIVIPKLGLKKNLAEGDNIIEFTPEESGVIPYSCWMGMIRSKITVVDDIAATDSSGNSNGNQNNTGSGKDNDGSSKVQENNTDNSTQEGNTDSGEGNASGNPPPEYNNLLDARIPTDELVVATARNGIQTVQISIDDEGFSPAVVVVQQGLETQWKIVGEQKKNVSNIIFPYYYSKLEVKPGENRISFYPEQDFDFYTEDNLYYGFVKVVEDINQIDKEAIKEEIAEYQPAPYSDDGGGGLPSCH
jgi:sulfite exporter TauE/SafE/copper chaperone CopZ